MKFIRSVEDSRIIERELDDIKSSRSSQPGSGNSGRYGNNSGSTARGGNSGNALSGSVFDDYDGREANSAVFEEAHMLNLKDTFVYVFTSMGTDGASYMGRPVAEGDKKRAKLIKNTCCCGCFAVIAIVIALIAFIIYVGSSIDAERYEAANAQMQAGNYQEAAILYEELRNYEDSKIKASEARLLAVNEKVKKSMYEEAVRAYPSISADDWRNTAGQGELQNKVKLGVADSYCRLKEYQKALDICSKLNDMPGKAEIVKECEENLGGQEFFAAKGMEQGSLMTFGRYEQDNNAGNGPEPIEWFVAANVPKEDGIYLLLLSKYCLDCRLYQDKAPFVEWKNCSLHNWLNNDFYNKAFTKQEREKIQTVEVYPEWNEFFNDNIDIVISPRYAWSREPRELKGPVAKDKVFVLAYEELGCLGLRLDVEKGVPCPYAVSRGAEVKDGCCWYWLREHDKDFRNDGDSEYAVSKPRCNNHSAVGIGLKADSAHVGVRPAVIIAVKKKPAFGAEQDADSKATSSVPAGS